MKLSLRVKVTLILTISIAFTIILCWSLNHFFLEGYYQHSKMKMLDSAYTAINQVFYAIENDLDITDDIRLSVEKVGSGINVDVYIRGWDGSYVYTNNYNSKTRELERITSAFMLYDYLEIFASEKLLELDTVSRLKVSQGRYGIYKLRDVQIETDFMDLHGYLDNGYLVLLRTNLESIQESVSVSNKFLTIIGIFSILVGSIVMFLFSRSFSKPINHLSVIAEKMSELDFDSKYTGGRRDEVGRLGNSINLLSEKLERTISELKTANLELEKDIQNKIQVDEMRKEFLSNVSHELKTPIALIQGYAEGLQENVNEDAENREFYCEVIMDEAKKMNKMVQKLLSLNQLEFGSDLIELERFDLVLLIHSVLSATEILMKQKEIRLIFKNTEPVYVWADEYRIEEVITNYISNAIHHAAGEKLIHVKLILKEDTVRVCVYNSGEPIPEADAMHIWEKFYKVDKARTREYGGNGIGLSIVKAIMVSHNKPFGLINYDDGVEFWFELDMKKLA